MSSWKSRGELGGPLGRGVDVLVAEHLAADLHAALVAVAHRGISGQVLEHRRVNAAGLLDAARWARPRGPRRARPAIPSAIGPRLLGRADRVVRRRRSPASARGSAPSWPRSPTPRAPRSSRRTPRSVAQNALADRCDHVGPAPPRTPGVNHRSIAASTTASVPPARTGAARSRHISGGRTVPACSDHQPVDALRRVRPEPHGDRAADREAAERDPLQPEPVEQVEHVARQLRDRVRPRRRRRPPCPRWS